MRFALSYRELLGGDETGQMLELAAHRPKTGTSCPYCYPLSCLHIISSRSTDLDVAVSDTDHLDMGFNHDQKHRH